MPDAPLSYEAAAAFHRVRSERLVHGVGLAVVVAMAVYTAHMPRAGLADRLVLDGALVLLAAFAVREAWKLLRARGGWSIRIAGDRLYLRLADDPSERSVEIHDLEHVMEARYGSGNQRHGKVFLLLRDARCWEIPAELLFPRRPLLRAILRAAPHATCVTNGQMPVCDPMRDPPRGRQPRRHRGIEQAATHLTGAGASRAKR
jgi:hypothetical protein